MPRCCKGARTPILLGAAIIALVAGRQGALADESGASFWLLGSYASQAAVPSTPGWSIDMTYYYGAASADRGASFRARRADRGGHRYQGELSAGDSVLLLRDAGTRRPGRVWRNGARGQLQLGRRGHPGRAVGRQPVGIARAIP